MSLRLSIVTAGAALACSAAASANIIAFSSFEEPAAIGGQYVDTLDALVDHALIDNPGEPLVNFGGGIELGFSSFYTNTRDDVGLTDGDFVGVTDFAGAVGAFTDGLQGFQLSDTDGLMTTSMQTVDLTGVDGFLAVDLFVNETGWETGTVDDRIRVWVEVDGGVEIDLLNTAGNDIDDLDIEGSWMTLTADLTGYTTATLRFELDSNSSSEAIYVDNAVFALVPGPGAAVLLGLAGLAGRGRRRN